MLQLADGSHLPAMLFLVFNEFSLLRESTYALVRFDQLTTDTDKKTHHIPLLPTQTHPHQAPGNPRTEPPMSNNSNPNHSLSHGRSRANLIYRTVTDTNTQR